MTEAELVAVQARDGVVLDGVLFHSAVAPQFGVDLVIFHHGVGGNFYRSSLAVALTERLVGEGCSVLRVNNRGHDQLYSSPGGWLGAAFEVVDDCRPDFDAWLDFADARGFERTALWGHSLGAVKSIYYLALEQDPRVVRAVAASPPRFHHQSFVAGPDGVGRAASLAAAQAHLDGGRPDQLVEFDIELGRPMWFSAASCLDKYGPADRYDFFRHLPEVTIPLLLTIGELEGGFSFEALAKEGPDLARAYPGLTFASVAGADHSYLSRVDAVWSSAKEWFVGP